MSFQAKPIGNSSRSCGTWPGQLVSFVNCHSVEDDGGRCVACLFGSCYTLRRMSGAQCVTIGWFLASCSDILLSCLFNFCPRANLPWSCLGFLVLCTLTKAFGCPNVPFSSSALQCGVTRDEHCSMQCDPCHALVVAVHRAMLELSDVENFEGM